MNKLIQCGNCVYFRIDPNNRESDLALIGGTCHREPPQSKYGFPVVYGEDFCGEGVKGDCPFEKTPPRPAVFRNAG